MFRTLSDEESRQVRRWQAPQLAPSTALPLANVEQTLARIEAGRGVLSDGRSPDMAHPGDVGAGPVTGPGPSLGTGIPACEDGAESQEQHRLGAALEALRAEQAEQLERVREEAYAAGFAEGNVKAREQLEQALVPLRESLQQQVTTLERRTLAQLVHLARDMAALVLQHEITLDADKFVAFVERALGEMPDAMAAVRVAVHPQDRLLLAAAFDAQAHVSLVEDASLPRGSVTLSQGGAGMRTGFAEMLAEMADALALDAGGLAFGDDSLDDIDAAA